MSRKTTIIIIIVALFVWVAQKGKNQEPESTEATTPQESNILIEDETAVEIAKQLWDNSQLKYSEGFPQYKSYTDSLQQIIIFMQEQIDKGPKKYIKLEALRKKFINSKKNSKAMKDFAIYGQPWGEGQLRAACEVYLDESLNDPESLEIEEFRMVGQTKNAWAVQMTYRARNGFGALVLETREFDVKYSVEYDSYYVDKVY